MIRKYDRCPTCSGTGMIDVGLELKKCPDCQGDGVVEKEYPDEGNEEVREPK